MKKIFKVLLASSMALSLAACSSDEDSEVIEEDPEPEIEDPNWKENLDGTSEIFSVNFGDEVRDVIVQAEDNITLRFYYDQEAQENYNTIVIPFGQLDEQKVFDDLLFMDYNDDGYDDLEFHMYDYNENEIIIGYLFNSEYYIYDWVGFDSLDGEVDSDYVDTWCLNADPTKNQFIINDSSTWKVLDSTGEVLQEGYAYESNGNVDLYDCKGELVGDIEIQEECLLVTLDQTTEYYYRQSNSTVQ